MVRSTSNKPSPYKKAKPSPYKKIQTTPTRVETTKGEWHVTVFTPKVGNSIAFFIEYGNGKEAFSYPLAQYIRGEFKGDDGKKCPAIDAINIIKSAQRRQPFKGNDSMMEKGYDKRIFISYPRNDKEPTEEDRMNVGQVVRDFLQDQRFFRFPAQTVKINDITNDGDDEIALDAYFMDVEIKEIVKNALSDEFLVDTFYEEYPEEAKYIYKGNYPSTWAKNYLGFPN